MCPILPFFPHVADGSDHEEVPGLEETARYRELLNSMVTESVGKTSGQVRDVVCFVDICGLSLFPC